MAERKSARTLIRGLIIKKKTDDQIITAVKKDFPESKVDSKHCTKYRKELFNEGKIDAALAARGSAEHREWALANMANAKKGVHKVYWIAREKAEKAAAAEKAKAEKARKAAKAKAAKAAKAKPTKPAEKAAA